MVRYYLNAISRPGNLKKRDLITEFNIILRYVSLIGLQGTMSPGWGDV